MTIIDDIAFSVPKTSEYTFLDVYNELNTLYGQIHLSKLWYEMSDCWWYIITIKWNNEELVKTLKAGMFDYFGNICVGHKNSNNHTYFFDVGIYSYKLFVYGQYPELFKKANQERDERDGYIKCLVDEIDMLVNDKSLLVNEMTQLLEKNKQLEERMVVLKERYPPHC